MDEILEWLTDKLISIITLIIVFFKKAKVKNAKAAADPPQPEPKKDDFSEIIDEIKARY